MVPEREKINLIYILGFDHGGSTIMDMSVGSFEGVNSLGEFWAIGKWFHKNRICSCGLKFKECPLWKKINARIENNEIHLIENGDLQAFGFWDKIRLNFFNPWMIDSSKDYGDKIYQLLLSIRRDFKEQIDYFLDSSKYLERLIKYHQSGFYNLKVIHLRRNGLALYNSYTKAIKRKKYHINKYDGYGRSKIYFFSEIVKWELRLQRQNKYLRKCLHKDAYIKVKYEDFTTDPQKELKRIGTFLDLPYSAQMLSKHSKKYIFKQERHLIGGNRTKFSPPDSEILPRENWKKEIKTFNRILFFLLGGTFWNSR